MRDTETSATPLVKSALAAVGFVLIVYACIKFSKATPFPSSQTLYPVVGAALMIAAALCGLVVFVKYQHTEPRSARFGIEKINAAIKSWEYPTKMMVSKKFPNGTNYWEINASSDRNVLFIGSSHMCQWAPAIDRLAKEQRLTANVLFIEVSGCGRNRGPVEGYRSIVELMESGVKFDAIAWGARVVGRLRNRAGFHSKK